MTALRKNNFWILLISCTFWASACHLSYTNIEYKRGEQAARDGHFDDAVKHFGRVVKREPQEEIALAAARQAARIALFQTGDFKKAIEFFEHLIVYSKISRERREAQRNVASIYFDKLNDYQGAIGEFNKLLSLPHSPEEGLEYRFSVAKSYYYLNNFFQAQTETDELLKQKLNDQTRFELLLFKGNIYLTDKNVEKALELFKKIRGEFPDLARKEKIDMSIAVCFEELNEYDQAIKVLENMKQDYPNPDFIDLKIRRLQQRQANLPGAKGYIK